MARATISGRDVLRRYDNQARRNACRGVVAAIIWVWDVEGHKI
jgi:hypothetical protein